MDDVGLPAGDEFIKYEVDITPDPPEWRLAAAKAELERVRGHPREACAAQGAREGA